MIEKVSGIYYICHKASGKIYVGSSEDIYGRWQSHKGDARRNAHHSIHFQRVWDKYGGENAFNWVIKEAGVPIEKLEVTEQLHLDVAFAAGIALNICRVAGNCAGRPVSDDTKEKMRQAKLGTVHTEEWKEQASERNAGSNNPFFDKRHTDETRQLIRDKRKNQVISVSSKLKKSIPIAQLNVAGEIVHVYISLKQAERHGFTKPTVSKAVALGCEYKGFFWKGITPEQYLELAPTHTNTVLVESQKRVFKEPKPRPTKEETSARISAAKLGVPSGRKGVKLSEDHVRKLSESHRGYVMPELQKKAISDAHPKRSVESIDPNTGECVEYPSMQATRKAGFNMQSVDSAVKNGWLHKGFWWRNLTSDTD